MKPQLNKPKKVVLAYSGGLDTSIIIPWLKENYSCEVIAVIGDVGQQDDLEAARKKALATGASSAQVEDLREEFVREYIWPTLRAGAVYEHTYLLGTSMARPVIAKRQAEIALKLGADGLSHGCTGKGNDQVRFELAYKAIAPNVQIIAPWREWDIDSREDAIAYAQKHNVPVEQSKKNSYSRDRNIWHLSHEGGELEDPANAPNEAMWQWVVSPEKAPDKAEEVEIGFESGTPVSVNGSKLGPVDLLNTLNEIAAKHGIGRDGVAAHEGRHDLTAELQQLLARGPLRVRSNAHGQPSSSRRTSSVGHGICTTGQSPTPPPQECSRKTRTRWRRRRFGGKERFPPPQILQP